VTQFFAWVRTCCTIVAVDGDLDFNETHQLERFMYANRRSVNRCVVVCDLEKSRIGAPYIYI